MKYSRVLDSTFALAVGVAIVAAPAVAQDSATMHVSVHVPDSVAHVTDREVPSHARFGIVSRDGQAALLLMDTTIVAQMTDRGLARMALGAMMPLFDHGIAYHLRDLADAKYADGRLQLLRSNGEEVFRDVEIGKGPLMESFSPDDAKAFAARARAARARLDR